MKTILKLLVASTFALVTLPEYPTKIGDGDGNAGFARAGDGGIGHAACAFWREATGLRDVHRSPPLAAV